MILKQILDGHIDMKREQRDADHMQAEEINYLDIIRDGCFGPKCLSPICTVLCKLVYYKCITKVYVTVSVCHVYNCMNTEFYY